MSKEVNVSNGGCSMLGLLGIVFVTLKLMGYITWSWWWVTAPFWGGIAILFAILAVVGAVLLVGVIIASIVAYFNK